MKKPRIPGKASNHLGRLLNMKYKPSELAAEICCSTDTIYKSWIPAGCPHYREDGKIWIVGTEFVQWVKNLTKKKPKQKLGPDQGWCMHCKKSVALVGPETIKPQANHAIDVILRQCAICGGTVARIRKKNDQSRELEGAKKLPDLHG